MFYYKSEAKPLKKSHKIDNFVSMKITQGIENGLKQNESEDETNNDLTIDDIFSNVKATFLPPLSPKVQAPIAVNQTAIPSLIQRTDNNTEKLNFNDNSGMEIEKFEKEPLPQIQPSKTVTLQLSYKLPFVLQTAKKSLYRCFKTNKIKSIAKRLSFTTRLSKHSQSHMKPIVKFSNKLMQSASEKAAIQQLNQLVNNEYADFFGLKQYQKDADDIEYDRGRVKKIKKRVLTVKPDFQRLYESSAQK